MMQECKRLLNGETADEGLLCTRAPGQRDMEAMDLFQIGAQLPLHDKDASGHADLDSAEHEAGALDCDDVSSVASDHEAASSSPGHNINQPAAAEPEPSAGDTDEVEAAEEKAAPARTRAHICSETLSQWDDWYHRGPALVDLDLYTYSEHFERCPKPKASSSDDPLASIRAFQSTHGLFFAFD